MARIKIKHPTQTQDDKRALLSILGNHNVFATKVAYARDGFIILTSLESETDSLFSEECLQSLQSKNFQPLIPPELKAKRTILLFSIDAQAMNHTPEHITTEIYRVNEFTQNKILSVFKFPNNNILKITFTETAPAQKSKEQGIKLYNTRVPPHQIKEEEFIPIKTCLHCYKLADHYTNQCPSPKERKVCSECSEEGHTWKQCTANYKKCLNCNGNHSTLAYKCPTKKAALQAAREEIKAKQNQTYSSTLTTTNLATSQNTPILPAFSKDTSTKILACMIHAHLVNIAEPGSYQNELNKVLDANSLPTIIIPDTPNSREIINLNISPPDSPSPSNNEEPVRNAQHSTSLRELAVLDSQDQDVTDSREQADMDTETESEEVNNSENESSTDSDSGNEVEVNVIPETTEQTHILPPKSNNKASVPPKNSDTSNRYTCAAARALPSPVSKHTRKNKDSSSCKQK